MAKQELARLRIAQLKEEQQLSREIKDLEEIRQRELKDLEASRLKEEHQLSRELKELEEKREMLKAKQELELATVERQVYEEEFERGGYIPPGKITVEQPCSSQQRFTIPSSKYVDNKPSRRVDDATVQVRDNFEHVRTFGGREPSILGPQRRLPAFGDEETAPKQFAGIDNSLQTNYLPRHGASPLPTPDLVKFDGNPVHYPVFVSNFEAHVGNKLQDPASRL